MPCGAIECAWNQECEVKSFLHVINHHLIKYHLYARYFYLPHANFHTTKSFCWMEYLIKSSLMNLFYGIIKFFSFLRLFTVTRGKETNVMQYPQVRPILMIYTPTEKRERTFILFVTQEPSNNDLWAKWKERWRFFKEKIEIVLNILDFKFKFK